MLHCQAAARRSINGQKSGREGGEGLSGICTGNIVGHDAVSKFWELHTRVKSLEACGYPKKLRNRSDVETAKSTADVEIYRKGTMSSHLGALRGRQVDLRGRLKIDLASTHIPVVCSRLADCVGH